MEFGAGSRKMEYVRLNVLRECFISIIYSIQYSFKYLCRYLKEFNFDYYDLSFG